MKKKLLLLSNSTNPGKKFLQHAKRWIKEFLEGSNVKTITIIAWAAIPSFKHKHGEDYFTVLEKKIRSEFEALGYKVFMPDMGNNNEEVINAINQSDAIVVTGGNTYYLLNALYKYELFDFIRDKVMLEEMPYIGWSAGANVACPNIMTTNDMPVACPGTFNAMRLVDFQINPHHPDKGKDKNPGAETKEDRMNEFMAVGPDLPIVGLRNGSAIQISGEHISLLGRKSVRVFHGGVNWETRNVSQFHVKE